MGLKLKSILITGCSSGIGQDAAMDLHRRGWQVFASCRQEKDCVRLRADGLTSPHLDYSDEASITEAVQTILESTGGTLDAVFHNGAQALPAPIEDIPTDGMRALFEANFFGWHSLTRAVLPAMRNQGFGRIVFNSSVLGFVPAKWRGAYAASKYAVEAYADILRMEMRDCNIKVSIIQPGPIKSAFRENATKQFERWIDWEASPRAEQYRDNLLDQLYTGSTKNRFQLPPSAVTAALFEALTDPDPQIRYRITTPTRAIAFARRFLSDRALDRILRRA